MRITAKADYAVRAAAELAAAEDERVPVKGEQLARSQAIPQNFLENILTELRRAGIVRTRRGADGGYQLARPAGEITVADVLRAVEGPLAAVQGDPPRGPRLRRLRRSTFPTCGSRSAPACARCSSTSTLADLADGHLPRAVTTKTADPDAWHRR